MYWHLDGLTSELREFGKLGGQSSTDVWVRVQIESLFTEEILGLQSELNSIG
jgi:hypothetical protein